MAGWTCPDRNLIEWDGTIRARKILEAPQINIPLTAGSVVFSDGTKLTEDNSNLFWDNVNKNLGIGTASPQYPIHIARDSGTITNLGFERCTNDIYTSGFDTYKARGTLASKQIVQDGDYIGSIAFKGWDGSFYLVGAEIGGQINGTPVVNEIPADMIFLTNPGALTPTERMRIDKDGNVGIGTTSPTNKLTVAQSADSDGLTIWGYDNRDDKFCEVRIEGDGSTRFFSDGQKQSFTGFDLQDNGNISTMRAITNDLQYQWFRGNNGTQDISFVGENTEGITKYFACTGHHGATNENAVVSFDPLGLGINVGIGTSTPTQPFSVKEKSCMTAIGGFAIKLTNKTGANSIAGGLVKVYTTTAIDDAVMLAAAGDVECFGVFLDAGVTDGSEAWVVISGIADVAFDDNVGTARGDWVSTGVLAGYAAAAASPAAAPTHFEEIGHCIESVAAGGAGTHILARCVLHFN